MTSLGARARSAVAYAAARTANGPPRVETPSQPLFSVDCVCGSLTARSPHYVTAGVHCETILVITGTTADVFDIYSD